MKTYPTLAPQSLEDVKTVIRFIVKERVFDVQDFTNLPQIFMSGRKVGKIPSSSNDVSAEDRIGDFNTDKDYLYIVVEDTGNAKWRRIALATW